MMPVLFVPSCAVFLLPFHKEYIRSTMHPVKSYLTPYQLISYTLSSPILHPIMHLTTTPFYTFFIFFSAFPSSLYFFTHVKYRLTLFLHFVRCYLTLVKCYLTHLKPSDIATFHLFPLGTTTEHYNILVRYYLTFVKYYLTFVKCYLTISCTMLNSTLHIPLLLKSITEPWKAQTPYANIYMLSESKGEYKYMKLPCIREDGSKLYVHVSGYLYAMNIYKNYDSIKELCSDFGVPRNQIEFWYSRGE